jgi:putative membrane protein
VVVLPLRLPSAPVPLSKALRAVVPPDPRRSGTDPDYRFTLANERTFLAWIRTALALSAAGLAAIHLLPDFTGRDPLGVSLLALSVLVAVAAYRRWALAEAAMRRQEPLPASRLPAVIAVGTAAAGVAASILFVVEQVR